mmetsp:Transcript_10282/g.28276  ORF Transcript_10282/g.28276 Transcript_10282/m.28276 type:complete len:149 (-) Transcript_10282:2090-2536(-)
MLQTAQRLIRLCLRADALARSRQVVSDLRHGAHDCGSSVQEDVRGAKQARESFRNSPTCGAVTTLRARAVKYAQSGARVAKRLAEQAKEAASDREQVRRKEICSQRAFAQIAGLLPCAICRRRQPWRSAFRPSPVLSVRWTRSTEFSM